MKLKLLRWLLPAIVPAALMFGAATSAHAVSYNCDGPINPVPSNPMGSVEIEVTSGDCVIDHDVTAQGQIQIVVKNGGSLDAQSLTSTTGAIFLTSDAGNIKAKNVTAGTVIDISAGLTGGSSASTIDVENIISNTEDVPNNANIRLRSFGPVKTLNIKANGIDGDTQRSGAVEISANMSGANNLLTIGGAGGINGTIDTRSIVGGGTQTLRVESGIRITNGTADSTGGITLVSMSNLLVKNTNSRSGQIELNARKGTLTLPSGVLDVSELNGKGAGFVFLLAKNLVAQNGTIIRANQATSSPGYVHQVQIAAELIQFSGTSGLTITADGGGVSAAQFASVYVLPQGGITSITEGDINSLLWTRSPTGTLFEFPGTVTFDGGGTAPLTISTNGNFSRILITGYPVIFDTGDVIARSRGNGVKNEVIIGYGNVSQYTDDKGLKIFRTASSSKITVNTNGLTSGDKGGYVQIQSGLIELNGSQHTFSADAANMGDANGGQVIFTGRYFDLQDQGRALISADAAPMGVGDAKTDGLGAIYFYMSGTGGQITKLGVDSIGKGYLQLTANGGKNGGQGGFVTVGSQTIQAFTSNAISAIARGGNANGGKISLEGVFTITSETTTPLNVFKASGHGTGEGGSLVGFFINTPFDIMKGISVDGGANLAISGQDGWLNLNNVKCQQTRVATAFPKSYWNCAHPDAPEAKDRIPVDELASFKQSVKNKLRDSNNVIFAFENASSFLSFTQIGAINPLPLNAGGFTYTWRVSDPTEGYLYVNVFQNGTLGKNDNTTSVSYDDNMYREASAHEISHAIDSATDLKSQGGYYRNFVLRDMATLDYVVLGADQTSSTPRLPCRRTPMPGGGFYPGAAPFRNVIDLNTGAPVCNGNNPNPIYNGLRNSQILGSIDSIWAKNNPLNTPQWLEGYAQTTAYRKVGNLGIRPMVDQVYGNNYFACARAYANAVLNGNYDGPGAPSVECVTSTPTWFSNLFIP